jgi:hypothetical protein
VISNGSIVASSTSDGLPKANPILDQTDPLTLIISSILNTSMQDSISSSSSPKLDLSSSSTKLEQSSVPIWISENREEMGGIKSLRDAIFQHSKSLHLQSASRDPKKVYR